MNQIRKASRKNVQLRLGIAAPSGYGKTLGALIIAFGLLREEYPSATEAQIWDMIGFIDTEEGSGELYVGMTKRLANGEHITIGEYNYLRISAPYSIPKYLDGIYQFNKLVKLIIIDSTTHAWAGSGGLLDKQGKITDESKSKNSYIAWRQVTPEHNAFIDAMLHSPCHIIATARSKTEYAMEGKNVIKLGMSPIQREGMEYEFTVFFDIAANSVASASKDRTDLFSSINGAGMLEKKQFIITTDIGAQLAKWLSKGIESIEVIAERIATQVAVSTDLNATYAQLEDQINRIHAERPEWGPLITGLFDSRNKELQS